MKLSFKQAQALFFVCLIVPVAGLWFLVANRIEERQIVLQRFLQNQIDIDRQIINQRQTLRTVHADIRSYLLAVVSGERKAPMRADVHDAIDSFEAFWKRYDTTYRAEHRPVLKEILAATQEARLVDEETETIRRLFRALAIYHAHINEYAPLDGGVRTEELGAFRFLEQSDELRADIFDELNHLADIRYIFAQRTVFALSGENERQYGFFTAVFTALSAFLLVLLVVQHFSIFKPFRDIMAFLRDMKDGKRGQRLYFSSMVREIKESEEIINEFVDKAEQHEKH